MFQRPFRCANASAPFWRRLAGDRSGVVGPAVAVLSVSLLATAGIALDVGLYHLGNRDLRAATEAAALAAAMDPLQADARARAYLVKNGYDASVLKSVTIGRYCADAALDSAARFDPTFVRCPGNGQATAVKIVTGKASRRFLTGILGKASPVPDLAATATAARVDEAGLGVTSGLLTVSNPLVNVVNDLLGALLGIKLRLSTADIEGMMQGDVDAGLFFDALAARIGKTGTYGELVQGSYGLQDIALAAASASPSAATQAGLRSFAGQVGNGYKVPLSGLFGLGVWKNMPVGEANVKPALRAGLNAYQLISYAVQSGPAAIDLSNLVQLALPAATVRVAAVATGLGDRPRFSFGPAGETRAGTAEVRLQINVDTGKIPLLGSPVRVQLPILVDVEAAGAEIASIDCANSAEQSSDTRVTVSAYSGLVNAYIGTVPANAVSRAMPEIRDQDVQQARIVDVLGLLTVDARAIVQPVVGAQNATMVFGPGGAGTIGTPSVPGMPASVGNTAQVAPLLSTLTDSLMAPNGLQIKVLQLCGPLLCDSTPVRQQLLSTLLDPVTGVVGTVVDPLLDRVLAALGIQLGHNTVWVTGARCGVPVLI
ncbi:hypothetical protein [Novosphingobium sp. BL-8A]|uniref:hypothetical protein n=1 Tax=Novosphingobium sp. BL-8A TaxID=3127639 RepID=UPI003757CD46